MGLNDISILGWIHTFLCALALISGALQLAGSKGTPAHARRGNVYFLSMAIANVMALFIFHGHDLLIRSGQPRVLWGRGSAPFIGLPSSHWWLLLLGRLAASRQRVGVLRLCASHMHDCHLLDARGRRHQRSLRPRGLGAAGGARNLAGCARPSRDTSSSISCTSRMMHSYSQAIVIAVVQVRQFRRQLA